MKVESNHEASCSFRIRRFGARALALGLALAALGGCDEDGPEHGLTELADAEEGIYEVTSFVVDRDSCVAPEHYPSPVVTDYGFTVLRQTERGEHLEFHGCLDLEDCRKRYEIAKRGESFGFSPQGVYDTVEADGSATGVTSDFVWDLGCNQRVTMHELRLTEEGVELDQMILERVYFDADPEGSCDSEEGLVMAMEAPCMFETMARAERVESL